MQKISTPGVEVDWNGTHYEVLLTPRETMGRLGAFAASGEAGDGPPRHRHHLADEFFVVIDGRLRFWLNGVVSEVAAGGTFHIPPGIEHAFMVVGSGHAHWIAVLSPGGFESFFADVAARALTIPEVATLAAEYDMEITGPPLAVRP